MSKSLYGRELALTRLVSCPSMGKNKEKLSWIYTSRALIKNFL
jgi:hypothetical protein